MKTFIINKNHLNSLDDFYDEIEKNFIKDNTLNFGRNLDALEDVLYGGYGVFEPGETIKIIWENFDESKKTIKNIDVIEEIINDNKNIIFEKK
ncbi:barstar family protein [Candidatus Gracilibacteria bacterium]|nr:barstar family protein [Candidatus Gracilibacteria bacterium]